MNPITELRKAFPQWHVKDEKEQERFESLEIKKRRGKGTPKKRTAAGKLRAFTIDFNLILTILQSQRNSRNGDRKSSSNITVANFTRYMHSTAGVTWAYDAVCVL